MTNERFIKIWEEIVEMNHRINILDPNNPIEREEAHSIAIKLGELQAELEEGERQERLSRFTLIKGGE